MPELVLPDVRYRDSFRASTAEWGKGVHQDGSGLSPARGHDIATDEGFAAWVAELCDADHATPPPGYVNGTFRWVIVDGQYAGSVALRFALTDFLRDFGGHIGYGIRPSMRRRGLATFALRGMLDIARDRGMDRVLITCDDDNIGSARTIERCGGVLEDLRTPPQGPPKRRYWIAL